jgi:hypothetical protein
MRRERSEEAAFARKNLPCVRAPVCVAQEVGAELAVGEIL